MDTITLKQFPNLPRHGPFAGIVEPFDNQPGCTL